MGVGTSKGAFYEDQFHQATADWDPKYDNNEIKPDKFMTDKQVNSDPHNIYDDQGNIVDWGLSVIPKLNPMKSLDVIPDELPLLQKQSMKNEMPFPNNVNPDETFKGRFGNLPPSGILNDLKKPTGETVPLVRKIQYVPGVTGEPDDQPEKIDKAALKHNDEVFTGMNHGLALNDILEKHPNMDWKTIDQGFTTTKGRFVSREDAVDIAKSQDQIESHVRDAMGESGSTMLLSEDLSHLNSVNFP